jgi:metal-responsive CopG/Arc/MetJ family transcriptional regulator
MDTIKSLKYYGYMNKKARRLVTAWVDPALIERIDERAAKAERSRSAELRVALRHYLDDKSEVRGDELVGHAQGGR